MNDSSSRYCLRREGVINVRASGFSFCINRTSASIFSISSSFASINVVPNVRLMKSTKNATNDTVEIERFLFILTYSLYISLFSSSEKTFVIFLWLPFTPLGFPVEPEVYII